MPRALTADEWIEKARDKHGDKYDYSEVNYVNGTTKVRILCPKHGVFHQTPHAHARPTGGGKCPDCFSDSVTKGPKITTENWIIRARKKHGDAFDYSEVEYVNANQEVRIGCPDHGIFLQTPKSHLMGRVTGCPKCRNNMAFTTEEWVTKARKKHGGRYDYSEVEYVNSYTKVKIRCREHGIFEQTPNAHSSRGSNCPKCRNADRFGKSWGRRTTEEWISIAKATHGDRYDYSEVDYVNNYTPVKIRCFVHGEFEQRPNAHTVYGHGCPDCSDDSRRFSNQEIIAQFKEAHGERYDYSKVDYLNDNTKVVITCSVHGDFEQLPYSHKNGNNCPFCADEVRPNRRLGKEEWIRRWRDKHGDAYDYSLVQEGMTQTSMVTIICGEHGKFAQRAHDHQKYGCAKCARPMQGASTQEWIEKFKETHAEKYDYSEVVYKSNDTKVKIICPDHGKFDQRPMTHVKGQGCPRCAQPMRGATREEWIEKCNQIHGNAYTYDKFELVDWNQKVIITCIEHGDFEMLIGNHTHKTRAQGCPSCAESGFDLESPAELYCMRYDGPLGEFWKIGISSNSEGRRNTLQSAVRSTALYHDYEIVIEEIREFERGKDARDLENQLLSLDELRFYPNEEFQGYTELFTVNPLYALTLNPNKQD